MDPKFDRTIALVNLKHLENNLKIIADMARKQKGQTVGVVPMVKANAYGHGLVPVSQMLALQRSVTALGVATLEEALILRRERVQKPLWIFADCVPWTEEKGQICERKNLTPILHSKEDVLAVLKARRHHSFHIKINTGLNRLGLEVSEFAELKPLLHQQARFFEGIMTHYASPDAPRGALSRMQTERFQKALELCGRHMPRYVHAASTVAIAEGKKLGVASLCNVVRPGLGLYGYGFKRAEGLVPALLWLARVLKVRALIRGERVGYGGMYRAAKSQKEAILGVGYGDGLLRSLTQKKLGSRRVLGRVSMDLIAVEGHGLVPGQWLPLLGQKINEGETLAQEAGTIIYEVLTAISQRVPRIYEFHGGSLHKL